MRQAGPGSRSNGPGELCGGRGRGIAWGRRHPDRSRSRGEPSRSARAGDSGRAPAAPRRSAAGPRPAGRPPGQPGGVAGAPGGGAALPPGIPPPPSTPSQIIDGIIACIAGGADAQQCINNGMGEGGSVYPNTPGVQCDAGYFPVNGTLPDGRSMQWCVKPGTPPAPPYPSQPSPGQTCCPSPPIIINVPKCPELPKPEEPKPVEQKPIPKVPELPRALGVNAQAIAGCAEWGAIPQADISGGFGDLSKLLGLRRSDGSLNVPNIDADPTGILTGIG